MTTVEDIVFWVAAVSAVLGGIGVITARSAIYSALSLILTLAQLAILYLLLNAQFIAAAQILIYAGAVMVLFLFVITLLGVQDYPFLGQHLPWQRPLSVIFAGLLLVSVIFFVAQSPNALTGAHGEFQRATGHRKCAGFRHPTVHEFRLPLRGDHAASDRGDGGRSGSGTASARRGGSHDAGAGTLPHRERHPVHAGRCRCLVRRDPLIMFMSIELMLNSVNLTFVTFSHYLSSPDGQIFVFIIMTVAAAEVVVGLALIVSIFQTRQRIDADELDEMRG